MKLSERLEAVQSAEPAEDDDELDLSIDSTPAVERHANPMAELIDRARHQLLGAMGGRINDAGSSDDFCGTSWPENAVARIAVALEKKLVDPREPKTVPEAPDPNAAPASAPLPRWIRTSPIMPSAISV